LPALCLVADGSCVLDWKAHRMRPNWVAAVGRARSAGRRPELLVPARRATQACRPSCWCVAAFASLAAIAAQPVDSRLGRLDAFLTGMVADSRTAAAIRAAHAVSALAEPGPTVAALGVSAVVAMRRLGWQAGFEPFLAVAAGMTARRKLSAIVARQRPPAAIWLAEPEGFSMPSKHTALAALTAGACAISLGAGPRTSHAAALLVAAGVGASRVYLGVHWPTDVLAGWLFSAGWLELCRSLKSVDEAPESWPVPQASTAGVTGVADVMPDRPWRART
jgi:membrane-associated phospholipid phosphatase